MKFADRDLSLRSETDIVIILAKLRQDAFEFGLNDYDVTRTVTAASELARNILKFAGTGNIRYTSLSEGLKLGLELVAFDKGPGIEDVERALTDKFSTAGTLGLGLPGVNRLVDEFECDSVVGRGTTITFKVWQS